jgi:hypothetical protein
MEFSPGAKRITAAGLFDLDDFSAELGEQPRRKWRSNKGSKFENPDTV